MPTPRTPFPGESLAEINVTPMIDVMLVLLIIFMVVTPAVAVQVSLPEARHAIPAREDRVTLWIDAAGRFRVENRGRTEPASAAGLDAALRSAYAARPDDHVLYLQADERASYEHVLTAIGASRAAGVSKVSAITERPAEANGS